ncbi:hypothetical protein ACQP2E_20885 [Actinoplanes sp. CA-015351]|uniref:hypothetical protein n=1 Tax=Actinoplanes sp. CA-015351 TaxID=3239897 RepID=UPI003D958AE4
MSESPAPANPPIAGDVKEADGRLLIFDGQDWVPHVRIADDDALVLLREGDEPGAVG